MDIIESVSDDGTSESKVMLLKYVGRSTPKRITFDKPDAVGEAVRMIQSCLGEYQASPTASRPRTKSVLPAKGGEDDDETPGVPSGSKAAGGKPAQEDGPLLQGGQKAKSDAPQLQGGKRSPG